MGVGGTSELVIDDDVVRVGDSAGTRLLLPVLELGAKETAPGLLVATVTDRPLVGVPVETDVLNVVWVGGGVTDSVGNVALLGDLGPFNPNGGDCNARGTAVGGAD